MSLTAALTLTSLRELADAKSFERGLGIFHDGAVGRIDVTDDTVSASVQGSYRYTVSLQSGPGDSLLAGCDCPVGLSGKFCKHAVALALTWLEMAGEESFPPPETRKPRKTRRTKSEQIADYLAGLDSDELRRLLQEASDGDRHLRDKLLFAAKAGSATGIAGLRDAVKQATKISGFLDWREAYAYAERLEDLAALLGKRIASGDAGLVELIEDAIQRAERALDQIDDSNGHVYPAIEHLAQIHLAACTALKPDPVPLATRLFALQIEGSWDTFFTILPDYEMPLGSAGLTVYRQLVEAEWQNLPPLGPAKSGPAAWDGRRHRLESAMESLAKQSGDVEAVAVVKSRNLSSARRFLELAAWYRDNGCHDEALRWIEQGMANFQDEGWKELAAFAIEERLRRGDSEEAERLAWERFTRHWEREGFVLLLRDAERMGRHDELRQKALDFLYACVNEEERSDSPPKKFWAPSARNELLAIYIHEGDGDKAWQLLKGGPTSPQLWEQVAALRGKTHPDEAVALYLKILPDKVRDGARNGRYEAAAEIVRAIRKLRLSEGQAPRFNAELTAIRAEYKAKRNFMAALSGLDG